MSPVLIADKAPSLFAGVDGGGTRCRVRLRDASGALLGEGEGGPANIRLGLNLVWANILSALDKALSQAGRASTSWDEISIGLGLAGIADASDVDRTLRAGPRFARADASTDAHTACLGAFSGRDGGLLIAGTGSAGYAWVGGKGYPLGGWGFEVCDDGSAASLGREAIRAALHGWDGLAPVSEFTRAVINHFGGHPADIVHWVTTAKPRDFGQLAPLTMQFAEEGDAVAVSLVEQSATDLGRYIARLHEMGAEKVCLVGGMAEPLGPWLSPWTHTILAKPEADAVEGAILMAHGGENGIGNGFASARETV
ncbi:BadF/BadG/BcrA/BcrD ATPase family protein [Asticcacaulis solisilvae]|uniref:BadF/BadG/BcrA/BcrD ATPase family protein n=1 Tax=Asticcacaulis solisilvae TaxID=1217274 RepID=UPI003FD6DBD1